MENDARHRPFKPGIFIKRTIMNREYYYLKKKRTIMIRNCILTDRFSLKESYQKGAAKRTSLSFSIRLVGRIALHRIVS